MADINKFTSKEVLNKVLLDSSGDAVNAFSHTTQEALNAALDAANNRLNVSLAGGTISGDVTIAGDLTVNGGGDFNFSEVLTGDMIIDQNANATALTVDAENTDATGVDMIFGAMDSGYGLRVRTGSTDAALTTGTLLDVYSKDSDNSTRNLMRIVNDDGNATGTTGLKIQQDSTGIGLSLDQNGDGKSIYIDSEATTSDIITVDTPTTTTGRVLNISDANSLTTGELIKAHSGAAGTQTRNLVQIVNDHASATGTTALKIQQDSTGLAIHTTGAISIDEEGGTSNSAVLEMKADRGSDGNLSSEIRFFNDDANYYAAILGYRGDDDSRGDLVLRTRGSGGTNDVRIDQDGATTLPSTLTVNGTNATIANATNPYLYINDTNAGAAIFQQSGNDTRIGSDSNTQVLFVQNNATAVTIDTSKNVGIGNTPEVNFHIKLADTANARIEDTSSDGIAKLDFKNDARTSTIGLYGDDSDNFKIDHGGGTVLTINTAQNVGIGTATPGFGIDSGEAITNASTLLEVAGTGGNADGATIVLRNTATAIDASTDSELGMIKFAGNDTDVSLNEDGVSSMIRCLVTDTWNATTNDRPSQLEFWTTADGSGAMAQNMTINKNGYVGIGTGNDIDELLHVQGASSTNAYIKVESVTAGNAAGIQLLGGAADESRIFFGDAGNIQIGKIVYLHGSDAMAFTVNTTEHFRIASNGDLTATDTSIASNSDERLKNNIQDYSGGLNIINKLRPVTFEYKDSKRKQGIIRGFIAQEVKAVDDYWVGSYNIEEKIDGINNPEYEYVKDTNGDSLTSKVSAKDTMYVSAIQELLTKINALETRVKELEKD
mgnify:CR=1 FL=1